MFSLPSTAALNHLLRQNPWAQDRLVRFSGKTARFNIAPLSFAWTVLPDGMLTGADAATSADATCNIPPLLLPRLALKDESAQAAIATQGDAALLTEIFFLFRNLRWDAADDLGKLVGDVAAERIVDSSRLARHHLAAAVGNFSQAAAEYLTEENPLLAKPAQLARFANEVDAFRDDLARLEARIRRLQTPGAR